MPSLLLSDIEASTQKWERHAQAMPALLRKHDAIVQGALDRHGGRLLKHTGDGVIAAFDDGDPVAAAIEIQTGLAAEDWTPLAGLRARIGIHWGDAGETAEGYFGPEVNRAGKVMTVGWGGQVVLTEEAAQRLPLPPGAALQAMGSYRIKGLSAPEQVHVLQHPALESQFPPLRATPAQQGQLPELAPGFIGRQEELDRLSAMLADPEQRLLTLSGPGGMGKTRLALELAARQAPSFRDGAYFADLSPARAAEQAPTILAEALRLPLHGRQDPQAQVLAHLRSRHCLCLLDNAEHLPGIQAWVEALLAQCAGLKLIVTSRERLNLAGEWLFEVEGLSRSAPAGQPSDAESLFLSSASRARGGAELGEDERGPVAEIVGALDGMPMGIELAAAWMRETDSAGVLQRLREGGHSAAGLGPVLEQAWMRLDEGERRALERASVFAGPFDRAAAQALGLGSPRTLAELLERSLLRRGGDGRYRLHNLVRQRAARALQADAAAEASARRAHAEHFTARLAAAETALLGPQQAEALRALDQELDDIRQAWSQACELGADDLLARGCSSFFTCLEMRGLASEGALAFQQAARAMQGQPRLRARLLARQGALLRTLSRFSEAEAVLNEAAGLLGPQADPSERGFVLNILGTVLWHQGESLGALEQHQEAMACYEAVGERGGIAWTYNCMGRVAEDLAELEDAYGFYRQGLEHYQACSDRRGQAWSQALLAGAAAGLGRLEEAADLAGQGLELARSLEDRSVSAACLNALGEARFRQGDLAAALELFVQCQQPYREVGDQEGWARALANLGRAQGALGLQGEAEASLQAGLQAQAAVGNRLGVSAAQQALGELKLAQGRVAEAARHFRLALDGALDHPASAVVARAMLGLAQAASTNPKEGTVLAAVELAAHLAHAPISADPGTKQAAKALLAGALKRVKAAALAQAREKGKRGKRMDLTRGLLARLDEPA